MTSDATNDGSRFQVNFASGTTLNLDEIRRRGLPVMPDGGHAWTISVIYAIEDPEAALDDMNLTADNFIGVAQMRCLLCHEKYQTANRFHKCPQTLPAKR